MSGMFGPCLFIISLWYCVKVRRWSKPSCWTECKPLQTSKAPAQAQSAEYKVLLECAWAEFAAPSATSLSPPRKLWIRQTLSHGKDDVTDQTVVVKEEHIEDHRRTLRCSYLRRNLLRQEHPRAKIDWDKWHKRTSTISQEQYPLVGVWCLFNVQVPQSHIIALFSSLRAAGIAGAGRPCHHFSFSVRRRSHSFLKTEASFLTMFETRTEHQEQRLCQSIKGVVIAGGELAVARRWTLSLSPFLAISGSWAVKLKASWKGYLAGQHPSWLASRWNCNS